MATEKCPPVIDAFNLKQHLIIVLYMQASRGYHSNSSTALPVKGPTNKPAALRWTYRK